MLVVASIHLSLMEEHDGGIKLVRYFSSSTVQSLFNTIVKKKKINNMRTSFVSSLATYS